MKRLLPLALLPILAACEVPPEELAGTPTSGEATAVAPAPLPPQVLSALPAGVPTSVVTRNADGCYLLTLEVTTPPTGYPLRDAAGNQVCEGSPVVAAATDLASVPGSPEVAVAPTPQIPGSITPPAPLAPLNPG